MEKKLGKGLGALIPGKPKTSEKGSVGTKTVAVDSIIPNKLQPRKNFDGNKLRELKDSIRENGVIQPVIVRQAEEGYELIAGERRFRAVKELGYDDIPVIIKDVTDAESLGLALIENIQREELNAIEEAGAYKNLMEQFNFSQDEISKAVGKDKSTVSNTLRLLSLPELIQQYISGNLVSMGHARAILSLPTERARIRFAKRIIKNNISVRQTEELIRLRLRGIVRRKAEKDEHIARFEEELQHHFGTRVRIIHGKKRGRIEISYFSNDDLDRLLNILTKKD